MKISCLSRAFIFAPLISFSQLTSANPELSETESTEYARACFDVVKFDYECGDTLDRIIYENETGKKQEFFEDTFSYWPSKVLALSDDGATIGAKVQVTFNCETGGNKGWSKPKVITDKYVFTCLSGNVEKGSFPSPVAYLLDSGARQFVKVLRVTSPTAANYLYRDDPPSKEFVSISKDTEDEYTEMWTYDYDYLGLRLAKEYFLPHLE